MAADLLTTKRHTMERYAVWLSLRRAGWSCARIGRFTGYARAYISHSINRALRHEQHELNRLKRLNCRAAVIEWTPEMQALQKPLDLTQK